MLAFLGKVDHFEASFLLDIHQLLVKQPAEDEENRMKGERELMC